MAKDTIYYNSPIGKLKITAEDQAIVELIHVSLEDTPQTHTALLEDCVAQLEAYFEGQRQTFDVPIRLHGTTFQCKVWAALRRIPYGTTCSYKDIAEAIQHPLSYRAVGGANNKNPIMILVPCHRVIGKKGDLVGFGGGLDMKQKLLDLEKRHH